ncbi:MAG: class A beta-lactamase-related serine hydrolase [Pedobacter sp.]|nr:MAG: class A beta-lactamase-related serine hydrolase [Pedobacter sp.]
MRILKKTLSITALLLLLLVAGVTVFDPLLFKILWYRVPVKETYTIFPQHFLTPAKVPFNFIKVKYPRNDLDTLHVRNGADSLIQLSQYIKQGKINAFIVIRNDSILYERYNNGLTDTTMVALFSVAKSMLSMAVGHAVDAGKIHIEKRVIEYVPELKANPAFNNITIGHLLSMRSGLDFKGTEGNFLDALLSDEARYYYTDDMKASLLSLKLVNRPGTVWKYKSVDDYSAICGDVRSHG